MDVFLLWLSYALSFALGFFIGYIKFVPDSPDVIRKHLQKWKEQIRPEDDSEVGIVRYKSEEEKRQETGSVKGEEEEMTALIKKIQENK